MEGAGERERGLDSQLWHACAGGMVQLPSVGSKVIYFPQGHGEQAASTPDFPRTLGPSGTIPCRVTSMHFLADTETDEVYARIRLQPETSLDEEQQQHNQQNQPPSPPPEKPASFAKTLTQSDANNGGGFSVPRYCAETIFPPLDYSIDPPVQTVLAKDVHGSTWKFRHIYRGTPRRHLLTTGWSNFVNQKKLVAGDAIVFLRSATGELCVGVRRSMRGTSGPGDSSSWHSSSSSSVPPSHRPSRWEVKGNDGGANNGMAEFLGENALSSSNSSSSSSSFARNRARVTAKSVMEAASLAVAGHQFEVVYYPRASTAEFCVKAHVVKAALDHAWYAGMRFKMAFETEDSSRISWFMGTIQAVQPADPHLWPKSPWRVLQVSWDEPDLLQGVSRVSPWQVEVVSTLPMQLPPFSLSKKKLRASQPSDLPLQVQGQTPMMAMPMAALANDMLRQMSPWHGLVEDVPAGMQGARQERICGLALSAFRPNKGRTGMHLDNAYRQEQVAGLPLPNRNTSSHQDWSGVTSKASGWIGMGSVSHNSDPSSNGAPSCGASSVPKTAPFLLFGQAIDPADKNVTPTMPKPQHQHQRQQQQQQQQHSGGSSSDDHSHLHFSEDLGRKRRSSSRGSDGYHGDTREGLQRFYSDSSGREDANYQQLPGGSVDSGVHFPSMIWMKEQSGASAPKDPSSDAYSHCKVFKESEEVGRTVDLALFTSYDDLFAKLSAMFGMDKMELQKNLVCRDAEGSPIHVGVEQYRDFMKSVRRITILSDASTGSCSAVRS